MTVGPLLAAAGVLLMLRIGKGATWLVDVLPAAVVFGAGAALVVAPLTSAVLDSAPDHLAGAASGVNNAVARAGGLLAVAVIPGLAGISGAEYADPTVFNAGFRIAIVIAACLLAAAAALAAVGIRSRPATGAGKDRLHVEECPHCPISEPPPYLDE
jgi:MFS family permease